MSLVDVTLREQRPSSSIILIRSRKRPEGKELKTAMHTCLVYKSDCQDYITATDVNIDFKCRKQDKPPDGTRADNQAQGHVPLNSSFLLKSLLCLSTSSTTSLIPNFPKSNAPSSFSTSCAAPIGFPLLPFCNVSRNTSVFPSLKPRIIDEGSEEF